MAQHGSLKDRLQKTVNLTSSADRIAALDAAEQASAEAVEVEVEEAAVVEEKIGTGKPSFDLAGAIAKIKATIARLNGRDPDKEATLLARIAALKANAK